jgi:hypothetical protein
MSPDLTLVPPLPQRSSIATIFGSWRWTRRRLLSVIAAVVVVVAVSVAVVLVVRGDAPTNAAIAGSHAITTEELEEQYGVRLGIVGLIAAGGLVEMKFQVLDADKATALFGPVEEMPKLAIEDSTRVLSSAKGMKHHMQLLDGASYFLLYTNVANAVSDGTQVAFVINGVRVPHLRVQQ